MKWNGNFAMKYRRTIIEAEFLERPNRFIAHVLADGKREIAHVKNTGRCRELLVPGNTVYLAVSDNPARKTKYDLIAVWKNPERLINMDSQIPNDAAEEWLKKSVCPDSDIRREVRHGKSRFDFQITKKDGQIRWLEVKGVTLERDGIAFFPDAPTERGVRHIEELIDCVKSGMEAGILFVIQMENIRSFRPNDIMHPEFGDALRKAEKAGVKIMARCCTVTPDSITISGKVPVHL